MYKALENDETEIVSQMCEEVDEHGLHILTILDNTVLHMLRDTILHMTAISNDKTHEVARKLLEKAPGLLCMRNNLGETALFRSVRYGNKEMFHFFAENISGYDSRTVNLYSSSTKQKAIAERKQKYESAMKLAKFLIKRDTSWEITYHKAGPSKPPQVW
ncbi:hypothetical protein CFP56_001008 [Quercus suber]|uniref:Uncharacterized protein n=1 Tax=Quercus suber TaxID=58331 RepID=A0AAW0LFW8_QUESU